MFLLARDLWHALSASEKIAWESAARPHHLTGYMWFMSQALRPNPGIYLPLLGGTMQGAIDMAGKKLENLPDPAADQEADTRVARNQAIITHKGLPAAHHAKYAITTGSYVGNNTVNRAIPHGLGVTPQFVQIWQPQEYWFILHTAMAGNIGYISPLAIQYDPVTLKDATNFYVGNALDFSRTANTVARGYAWAAFP